jgi:BirA family biotin operon repressor/biotin-[acetyl-CoA-carboxylase] ligase
VTLPIVVRDVVDSTQDEVHAWGESGRPHGSALLAREQAAGRGARGHRWTSPRGGLWLSVLVRPRGSAAAEVLSLRVGLAVAAVLERLPGVPPVRIKWPNDLMLADRKVGGILCEARWRGDAPAWVTIGVGLNVTNELPPELRAGATRLGEHTRPPEVEPLARAIVEALLPLADAPAELTAAELHAFERRDWLRGRRLAAPQAGFAAGVTAGGALLVRAAAGMVEARAGSVVLA